MGEEKEKWQNKKIELQYRYAWDWFSYHAAQRLTGFRFFLIIIGAVSLGYSKLPMSKGSLLGGIVCLFGAFISVGFYFLEIRNQELVNCGRNSLKDLEGKINMQIRKNDVGREYLSKSLDVLSKFFIPKNWRPTGETLIERLTKHRFWLRSIYLIVCLIFFVLAILNFWGKMYLMNVTISSQTVVGHMAAITPIIPFLSAIAPLVLAVLTGFYLWETRKMRKDRWKAHVSFEILPRSEKRYLLDVVIKNDGMGPAYDICFQFDREIPYDSTGSYKTLGSLPFLQKMEYLAPNSEKRLFFNTFMELKKKNYLMEFNVEVKYRDWFGKLQSESFHVDLKRLENIIYIMGKDIGEELEKIRKELEELNTAIRIQNQQRR